MEAAIILLTYRHDIFTLRMPGFFIGGLKISEDVRRAQLWCEKMDKKVDKQQIFLNFDMVLRNYNIQLKGNSLTFYKVHVSEFKIIRTKLKRKRTHLLSNVFATITVTVTPYYQQQLHSNPPPPNPPKIQNTKQGLKHKRY